MTDILRYKVEDSTPIDINELGVKLIAHKYELAGDASEFTLHKKTLSSVSYPVKHIVLSGKIEARFIDTDEFSIGPPGFMWPDRTFNGNNFNIIAAADNSTYLCVIPHANTKLEFNKISYNKKSTIKISNGIAIHYTKSSYVVVIAISDKTISVERGDFVLTVKSDKAQFAYEEING